MKTLELLSILAYGICGGMKIAAEIIGYWFTIVFVYYLCEGQLNGVLAVWSMIGSVVLYFFVRFVIELTA